MLGIEVPFDNLELSKGTHPVLPATTLSAKNALYILHVITNNLRFFANHSETMSSKIARQEVARLVAEKDAERAKNTMKDTIIAAQLAVEQVSEVIKRSAGWVLISKQDNWYLGKVERDEPLTVANLDFFERLEDAYFISSRSKAVDMMHRLTAKFGEMEVIRLAMSHEM